MDSNQHDAGRIEIVRLDGERHDRESFCCGEPAIDKYLKQVAGQAYGKHHSSTTHVLIGAANEADGPAKHPILGFVTLAPKAIVLNQKVPGFNQQGGITYFQLIAQLGVDRKHQGKKYAAKLVEHALAECVEIHKKSAFAAVLVNPLHERLFALYGKYGFIRSDDKPEFMYLPMAAILAASGQRDTGAAV